MKLRSITLDFECVDEMTEEDFLLSFRSWLWGSGLIGMSLHTVDTGPPTLPQINELRARLTAAHLDMERAKINEDQ